MAAAAARLLAQKLTSPVQLVGGAVETLTADRASITNQTVAAADIYPVTFSAAVWVRLVRPDDESDLDLYLLTGDIERTLAEARDALG